jgi:hypothetical protein
MADSMMAADHDNEQQSRTTSNGNSMLSMKDRISASATTMIKSLDFISTTLGSSGGPTPTSATTTTNASSSLTPSPTSTTTPTEGSSQLEQAIRHFFLSCMTGANGTVAPDDSATMMVEEEESDVRERGVGISKHEDEEEESDATSHRSDERDQVQQTTTGRQQRSAFAEATAPSQEYSSSSSSNPSRQQQQQQQYPYASATTPSAPKAVRRTSRSPTTAQPQLHCHNGTSRSSSSKNAAAAAVSRRNLDRAVTMLFSNNNDNSINNDNSRASTLPTLSTTVTTAGASGNDHNDITRPTPATTSSAKPIVQKQPLVFRPAKTTRKKQPTQESLGQHIYEHLFYEDDEREVLPTAVDQRVQLQIPPPDDMSHAGSKHLLPRVGIAPCYPQATPRLFPASSPELPPPHDGMNNKVLLIQTVPSEDDISAISSHTLEAMAAVAHRHSHYLHLANNDDSISQNDNDDSHQQPAAAPVVPLLEKSLSHQRVSKSQPKLKMFPSPRMLTTPRSKDESLSTYNNDDDIGGVGHQQPGRYDTPNSRSTTEDSSRSFEQWQDSERAFWTTQQVDTKMRQRRRRRVYQQQRKGDATLSTESSTRHDLSHASSLTYHHHHPHHANSFTEMAEI